MNEKIIKTEKIRGENECNNAENDCSFEEEPTIYTEKQRISKIKKMSRLYTKEYEILNPNKSPSVKVIIDRMAFLSVHLEEQEKIINRDGTVEEYQNGENQRGFKDSVATKVHDRMINDLLKSKKQLDDMKPNDGSRSDPAERILGFVNNGDRQKRKLC